MKNRWLMFIALYFSAFSISVNQFKVAPIMNNLAEYYHVSITSVAFLMSVFTITGIIVAIPSAKIVEKLGPQKLGVIIMALLTAGSLVGGFAPNFTVLMTSRVIEGVGFALIFLVGMVLVSTWFKPEEMAIPTGIFITFSTGAIILVFAFAGQLVVKYGWHSLWYVGTVLGIISLLLFLFIIRVPKMEMEGPAARSEPVSFKEGFLNGKVLLVAIIMGSTAFLVFSLTSLYAVIFTNYYHLDPLAANSLVSASGVFALISCILSGVVIAKTNKPNLVLLISSIRDAGHLCFHI
ncbi:MAG: MFS transporter [Dehalobacterium sp.]